METVEGPSASRHRSREGDYYVMNGASSAIVMFFHRMAHGPTGHHRSAKAPRTNQSWVHLGMIPTARRLRKEDGELKANLGYIRPCLKPTTGTS